MRSLRYNDISHVRAPGEFFDMSHRDVNIVEAGRENAVFLARDDRPAVNIEDVMQNYIKEKGLGATRPRPSTVGAKSRLFTEDSLDSEEEVRKKDVKFRERSYTQDVKKAFEGDARVQLRLRRSSSARSFGGMHGTGTTGRPSTSASTPAHADSRPFTANFEGYQELTKTYKSSKTGCTYSKILTKRGPTSVVMIDRHHDAITLGRTPKEAETRVGWDWRPVETDINDKSGLCNVFNSATARFRKDKEEIEEDKRIMAENGEEGRKGSF